MNGVQAAERVGITYRQFDHWVRCGYIKGGLPGSGNPRDVRNREIRVLEKMASLVKAGLEPGTAAPIARRLAAGKPVKFGQWVLTP